MRRNHFFNFSCHSGEANSSLKHLPTIIIETAVEAPGEAPSKTDNDPSAVVITQCQIQVSRLLFYFLITWTR
jgi:hypothetical protein